jgi:hypothetical protein
MGASQRPRKARARIKDVNVVFDAIASQMHAKHIKKFDAR